MEMEIFKKFLVLLISIGFSSILLENPALSQEKSLNSIIEIEKSLEKEDLKDLERYQLLLQAIQIYKNEKAYEKLAKSSIQLFQTPATDPDADIQKKEILKEAVRYESEIQDSLIKGNLHLKLAAAYFNEQKFDSAIVAYTKAIDRFSSKDSLYIADGYFFRGQAEDYYGNMLQAMKDYQTARIIYQNLEDFEYVDFVNGGLAILFSKYGIYQEAEEIRNELIQKSINSENFSDAGIQFFNQSEDYRKQKKSEKRIKALLKADSLENISNSNPYFKTVLKFNISIYYGEMGDLTKAKEYFNEGEKAMSQVPELDQNSGSYLMAQTRLLLSEGKISSAIQSGEKLLRISKEASNMDHLSIAYQLLEEAYRKSGQPAKALDYLTAFKSYQDSIFEVNQANSFAYYQTLYETERKENELLSKSLEVENLKESSRRRNLIFGGTLLLLLGGSGFGFLAFQLKTSKKEKALQENFSRELLKTQEEERKRISKDLHDGLGQSLLLIKNKVALNQSENAGDMLDTAINELRSIARSLHPMQLEKLGLSKALEQMLEQIDRETQLFVTSEIEEVKGFLPKEKELQLYRIAQEGINNILKHSQAEGMKLELLKHNSRVELIIEDNGKGFDFSEKFNDFHSLGLKTLKERTAAISGTMKVNSEKGKGTKLSFLVYAN